MLPFPMGGKREQGGAVLGMSGCHAARTVRVPPRYLQWRGGGYHVAKDGKVPRCPDREVLRCPDRDSVSVTSRKATPQSLLPDC